MIDPLDSLAFSIQANPGVYALLLGSGVSRAAGIPTGWEVTLDLIRKLAAASGESAGPDPEKWYREKYQEFPNYSSLIDALAKTQSERQQMLRPYFEPSEQEMSEGAKQPTSAHRAVAQLAAQGYVRVIITTNFDRLTEKALVEAGIEPTVLSSPDQVRGMLPLVHTRNCVIKVNGDYLDTRIRNTPSELSEYPNEINELLDRVFDEFGLVVCGWSADWDLALRDAMFRAPSRRFTTFWAIYGEASDPARQVISHRIAQAIQIKSADEFLETLQQKVESIEQYSRPHPISEEAAVASLKKYLSEPRYRIQLSDLIGEAVERTITSISTEDFGMSNPEPNSETVTSRVRKYESECSTLLSMAVVGGIWAEEDNIYVWQRALQRLAVDPATAGSTYRVWVGLARYPATLMLYALGLGALQSNNLVVIGRVLSTMVPQSTDEPKSVAQILPPFCMFGSFDAQGAMRLLEGMERHHTPHNDWIHGTMRRYLGNSVVDKATYDLVFDKLEVLIAMSYAYQQQRPDGWYWAPLGSFVHRSRNRKLAIDEMERSISTFQYESPFVKAGIFGESPQECTRWIELFNNFVHEAARSMRILY